MSRGTSVLYQGIVGANENGEAERLWVRRCDDGCAIAIGYSIRGSMYVIAPRAYDDGGMSVRVAWRAADLPVTAALGCKHLGRTTAIHAEVHPEGLLP